MTMCVRPITFGLAVNPAGFLLGACFWRRLVLALALCLWLAGTARAVTPDAGAGGSCPGNYFKLTPKGGNEFTLTYYENGVAKNSYDIVSGYKGKQPTEASKDEAGSNNPIPQGVFAIGTPVAQSTIDPSLIPEIGNTWIPIETNGVGGRSAIGFHTDGDGNDANIDGQSRGCVTLKNKATYEADIKEIADLVNKGAKTLIVDHGLKENPVAGICSPDGTVTEPTVSNPAEDTKNIAAIRNDLAKSCFGGPIIAFGFAVPMIFGEKLHETFAPYVSGVLMIVFAIWAYLKVGSALLPFGPKDKAVALFNAIGVRFFVVLGVSVFLLAPQTGYAAYRDYIITPILSAGGTIVDKMYQIGIDTNPSLARFAKEDGQCTPTPIKGLDAKLTALKDDLECKVCMIQRAYSYPWSYGLFQTANGKIFTGIVMMLVGIAPFVMFLFTVADVFMVRMGYVSCTLSAYVAAGCFPASRKYAITGLKSLSDGAMVLITSMIAAMISISMLTTVIENLDKGGQANFAVAGASTTVPTSETPTTTPPVTNPTPGGVPTAPTAPANPGGPSIQAFADPTTTYATGRMGSGGASLSYAAWYRDTYLRQDPPQHGGFDTFREKMLSDIGLGGVTLNSPFIGSPPPESRTVSFGQSFGWCRADWPNRPSPYHNGLDFGCGGGGQPMTPIAPCEVIYAGVRKHEGGYGHILDCRILLPDGSKSNVAFRYAHMMADAPKFAPGTQLNPGQVVGKCGSTGFSEGAHLHLEIYMDAVNVPTLYPGNASNALCGKSAGHRFGAPSYFGRNAYYLNPALLLAGAVPIAGIEAAGFSATANSFKNFGILDKGFLLVIIICIISLMVSKQSQKFMSSQGMGILMKALGQMIAGAVAAMGAVFTMGMKTAEALAPVAGWAGGVAGGMAGAALQATGLDKAVNRAAEGIQKTFDNVTQKLSGVMDEVGSNIGSMLSGAQTALTNAQQEVIERVEELRQGLRDLAAGIQSQEAVQRVMNMVTPGVAAFVVVSKLTAPVVSFVGREMLLPTAVKTGEQVLVQGLLTLVDPFDDLGLKDALGDIKGTFINTREALAKAPLSEAPARDGTAVVPQEGLVLVQDAPNDLNRSGTGPSDTERTGSNSTGERQATPNPYEVLGVGTDASWAEIKKAYGQLSKELNEQLLVRNAEGNVITAKDDRGNAITVVNQEVQDKIIEVHAAYAALRRDGSSVPTPQSSSPETSPDPAPPQTRELSGAPVALMPAREEGDTGSTQPVARGEYGSGEAIIPVPSRDGTGSPQPVARGEYGGGYQAPEQDRDSDAFEFGGEEESDDNEHDTADTQAEQPNNRGEKDKTSDTQEKKKKEKEKEEKDKNREKKEAEEANQNRAQERKTNQEIKDEEARKAAEERANASKEKRQEKEQEEEEARKAKQKAADKKAIEAALAEAARRKAATQKAKDEENAKNTITKFDRPRVPTGPKPRK